MKATKSQSSPSGNKRGSKADRRREELLWKVNPDFHFCLSETSLLLRSAHFCKGSAVGDQGGPCRVIHQPSPQEDRSPDSAFAEANSHDTSQRSHSCSFSITVALVQGEDFCIRVNHPWHVKQIQYGFAGLVNGACNHSQGIITSERGDVLVNELHPKTGLTSRRRIHNLAFHAHVCSSHLARDQEKAHLDHKGLFGKDSKQQ